MTDNASSRQPVVLSWSGGKDSALTLRALLSDDRYDVVALMTTVSGEDGRISSHGVRESLLDQQVADMDLPPLHKVYLPTDHSGFCTNSQYERAIYEAIFKHIEAGVTTVAFGDLFLEDLRCYRERMMHRMGMKAIFPLWMRDTTELACQFIEEGFKACLSCVDGRKLDSSFAGRPYDTDLLRDLPVNVDPCGEYGEFHSFVFDGPIFRKPVDVAVARSHACEPFHFVELQLCN